MISETWKPVVGYEGRYEVSDLGNVRSLDWVIPQWRGGFRRLSGRVLVRFPDKDGYLCVNLSRKKHTVHGLVAGAFIGPKPEGLQVRHANGFRDDPRLSNLSYGTSLENAEDRERHGHTVKGEAHCRAKLTPAAVLDIREQKGKIRQIDLAAKYGVSQRAISRVQRGESWK